MFEAVFLISKVFIHDLFLSQISLKREYLRSDFITI